MEHIKITPVLDPRFEMPELSDEEELRIAEQIRAEFRALHERELNRVIEASPSTLTLEEYRELCWHALRQL